MFAKSLGLAMKAMKALKKGPALRKGILKKKKDEEGSKNGKPMKKPASSIRREDGPVYKEGQPKHPPVSGFIKQAAEGKPLAEVLSSQTGNEGSSS